MNHSITKLIQEHNLEKIKPLIDQFMLSSIGFEFTKKTVGKSKMGGNPLLPANFVFPTYKDRPLDFLLQLNLSELPTQSQTHRLPNTGMLTFFYDFEDQPWGYDPADLDGFAVTYHPDISNLKSTPNLTSQNARLPEFFINLFECSTIPSLFSNAGDKIEKLGNLDENSSENYLNFAEEFPSQFRTDSKSGNHQLFGHSANIQGDMQLEAQLVTNGLYCGDTTGYDDPRRVEFEKNCDDWILLLQLDSDSVSNIMWGDSGMLYYWIKKQDLAHQRFDKVWMTLQCY